MNNDRQIVKLVLGGQTESFSVLAQRYYPKLKAFVCKLGLTQADGDDIVQESLLKAYQYLYQYDDRWEFSTWVFRIALNTFRSSVKRNGKRIVTYDSELVQQTALTSDCQDVITNRQWIEEMFRSLKDDVKAIVILRYYQDLSYKEIGDICGISAEAAKMKVARALDKLQRIYGDKEGCI